MSKQIIPGAGNDATTHNTKIPHIIKVMMVAMEPLGTATRGSCTIDAARLIASTPTYIQALRGNMVINDDIPPINIAE